MRYAVFGRAKSVSDYDDYDHVVNYLKTLSDASLFIVGGSRGVETLAERYCERSKIPFKKVRPRFEDSDKQPLSVEQAFDARNLEIIQSSDKVVVFWDGLAQMNMFRTALLLRKTIILFPIS